MSDRPLSRKILRAGFRLAGRVRAHHEEVWPGLRLQPALGGQEGMAAYRGSPLCSLLPAGALLDSLAPQPVIVGSGPSLRGQPVESLPGASCLLLNGAITLIERIGQPAAAVIEDERFVWRHRAMLATLERDTLCLLSPAVIRAIASKDRDWFDSRRVILIDDLHKPVHRERRSELPPDTVVQREGAAFSLDPGRGVIKCGTVAYTALQFALAAKVKGVALAGIDLTDHAAPRFYEAAGSGVAWSGLAKGQTRILAHFALAREVARDRGVALLSYAPNSRLLDLGYDYDAALQASALEERRADA